MELINKVLEAFEFNDSDAVEKLLLENEFDKSLVEENKLFEKALYWSCNFVNLKNIELLIKYNVNLNYVLNFFNPLQESCKNNNLVLIKIFVENGANLEYNGQHIIFWYFTNCFHDKKIIEYLIGTIANDQKQEILNKLLLSICDTNKFNIVKLLIKNGAKINYTDSQQCTPLSIAFEKRNFSMMKILINAKANIDDNFLLKAISLMNFNLIHFLLEYGAKINNDVLLKCKFDDKYLLIFKYLIKKEANVNAINENGEYPLYLATLKNCTNIVMYLIENGANIKLVNENSYKLLSNVCEKNNYDLAKFLIEKGCQVNSINLENKDQPLYFACKNSNIRLVKLLCENNTDINLQSKYINFDDQLIPSINIYLITQNIKIKKCNTTDCNNLINVNYKKNENDICFFCNKTN